MCVIAHLGFCEKTGVRADYSTGKVGDGPRAKELQAAVRRLQSEAEIEQDASRQKIQREENLAREQTKDEIKKVQAANKLIEEKFSEIKKEVNKARNFGELELANIQVNGLISSVASLVNLSFGNEQLML